MVSYNSRTDGANIYFHKSTVHDINNLKAVCDSSAMGARPKEAEPVSKVPPIEVKDLFHHDFGANNDSLSGSGSGSGSGSFSPQSHPSSQTSIHTEVFSPTPTFADTAANTPPSILAYESCDQERCSSSYSSLNLPCTSSFWSVEDTIQMPLGHHKHCAPIISSPSNMNDIAADGSTMSTSYDWADFPMDLFQPAPSSTRNGSNATADLPMGLLHPAPSSTHNGSNTTLQDGLEKIILPNNDFLPSSSYHSSRSEAGHEPQINVRLGAKRTKKLDSLLEMLTTASLLDVTEHNEIVSEIRQLCRNGSFHHRRLASGSFSADLEEPTVSSSAAKFAYDLLSWENYRQEEKRLIREEDLSSISASKEVNSRMMKARGRHSKTRDWASDGRKAAKMFFDALQNRDTVDRSFALLLLASNVSPDQMLKIAHFPTLRSSFASRFARIVEKKAEIWRTMSDIGFAVLNIAQVVDT